MKAATAWPQINLLPYRLAARRRCEHACVRLLAGGAMLGLLLALAAGTWLHASLDQLAQRQEAWRLALRQTDSILAEGQRVERETVALSARQAALAQLQTERHAWIALFDMLARTLPAGVVLHSVRQEEQRLRLQGQAASQEKVSALLLALGQAAPLAGAQLLEVRGTTTGAVEWTVQLGLTRQAGPAVPGA